MRSHLAFSDGEMAVDSQCEVLRSHDPIQADTSQRLAATGVNCTHLLSLGEGFHELVRARYDASAVHRCACCRKETNAGRPLGQFAG